MKYDHLSRRMFLTGAGNAFLSIPVLTSLLPRKVAAQINGTPPLRFLMVTNDYSPNELNYFGQFKGPTASLGLQEAPGNALKDRVYVKPLTDVAGDISYVLQPFNDLKSKISLLRGLDLLSDEGGPHPFSFAACASGQYPSKYNSRARQESVDSMIARLVYTQPIDAKRRQLVLYSYYTGSIGISGSWNYARDNSTTYVLNAASTSPDTRVARVGATLKTDDLLAKLTFTGAGAPPVVPGRGIPQRDLLSLVHQDYQRVRGDRRVAGEEKVKLDAYMALIADLQSGLAMETGGTISSNCAKPGLETEYNPPSTGAAAVEAWAAQRKALDYDGIRTRNHHKIVAAAMACDLTRVAAFHYPGGDHGYTHTGPIVSDRPDSSTRAASYYANQRKIAGNVANLMRELAKYREAQGTLLDNSVVYWGQGYGCMHVPSNGHVLVNCPVLVGGGAAGRLKLGYFVDYRREEGQLPKGVPVNNLFVTLMNCFGIGSSKYELTSGGGYGDYTGKSAASMPSELKSASARRTPLPFIYAGPSVG